VVIDRVVDAAEGDRRPQVVAFVGVVEHHVQNDFDSRAVQGFDQVAKFVEMAPASGAAQ